MHAYRSHTCGALCLSDAGITARLGGWVHRKRDHGQLLFVDLRDHYGITQCVIDVSSPLFAEVDALRLESVVSFTGKVVERSADTVNPRLPTGEIELQIAEMAVLSVAEPLPFPVNMDADYPEEMRLKYRFLDLRREQVHANIMLRSGVIASIRRRMIEQGFTEFQTPILTADSPEGARPYLVPSRLHPGEFYALPQAPQQFKQLLMVSGFDRYFQIAPCFRDEASRADRAPGEFYQLDFEMSFVTQEDVFAAIEPVLHGIFEEFGGGQKVTPPPFPRITYADAALKYSSDKPDLRNPIEMSDVTETFRGSGFQIFARMIEGDANVRVRAIPAPGGGSRAFCDRMNSWAQGEGQPGLGYIFFRDGEGAGPVARNLGPERTSALQAALGLEDGDAVFFVAGVPATFAQFAAAARMRVGRELGLIAEKEFRFCWIVDYPMYELNEETGKVDFSHNPFSMPQGGLEALETQDPLTVLAHQYDIVCNGIELASGAIRNHRPDIMYKAFGIAGYTPD
ncbi:MAG: aspartate--tRNA ligase, partial [Alphaproteobacteria bacterium]|nr:aspartate--tRNA ligase [Alphaproteobacteria bacterium]